MESSVAKPLMYGLLRDWYRQPLGKLLGAAEQKALADYLTNVFGYNLLLVTPPWESCELDTSRIPNQVILRESGGPVNGSTALFGSPEALPVRSDCLDVLILPHTLELSPDPYQVLREADRCLIPEGHLFVLGYNPLSSWGLWRLACAWRKRVPWSLHFYRQSRIKDLLDLLGFDTLITKPLFFRPPLWTHRALERLEFMERIGDRDWNLSAGAYLMVAKKRVIGITPIRSRWRPRRIMSPGLVEPTNRGVHRG